jgi:hypothetical protein
VSGVIEYPTPREAAVAIVAAARIHDEDPVLTVEGAMSARGRWLATAALQEAFPEAPHDWIAAACGVTGRARCQNARAEIRSKRFGREYNRAKWFLEADLESVKSALAAAIAETDAELRNRLTDFETTPCEPNLPPEAPNVAPADAPVFAPLFGGLKSDVLDVEVPDFSHLQYAPEQTIATRRGNGPKTVSAARVLADFQRSHIIKTTHGRIIDHRQVGLVDLGDPAPGRSALDQRGAP